MQKKSLTIYAIDIIIIYPTDMEACMNELLTLLANFKEVNTRLFAYLQINKINLPFFLDFDEIRDWCVEMRGYVKCLDEKT